MNSYRIVFTGRLQAGCSVDDVVARLMAMTNMDEAKARQFVTLGRPTVVRRNLEQKAAESLAAGLVAAGLEVQVGVESDIAPEARWPPHLQQPAAADRPRETGPKGLVWCETPKKVVPSHGWLWIKSASAMFSLSPWKWMTMVFLAGLLTSLLNLIPFVGSLCTTMLAAVLGGGLMMAAQDQQQGRALTVRALFRGFSRHRKQLLLVGFYNLCAWLIIGSILYVGLNTSVLTTFSLPGGIQGLPGDWLDNLSMLPLLMLVMLALATPVFMANWFATPLVALAGRTAWRAYRQSLLACLKNWLPLLVYGMILAGIGILATFAFFAVAGLLASFASGDERVLALLPAVVLAMLSGIPGVAVLTLTLYTGFLDIFTEAA